MKKKLAVLFLILGFTAAYFLVKNSPPIHGMLSIIANYLLILIPLYFFLKTFFASPDGVSMFNNGKMTFATCAIITVITMNFLQSNIHGGRSTEEKMQTISGKHSLTTQANIREIVRQDGFFIRGNEVQESWLVLYSFYVDGKEYYGKEIFHSTPDLKPGKAINVKYVEDTPTINIPLL
ncbi:hypothetical protein [Flavobacterium sp. KACC 22761]|uniref:hypothetical protein n=1 Tax=Flavobacterium sp. KACC 22761 TaxID=3092665 RepID=UPI002A7547C5|nr:hypothetical protein [Flavobacterium sp. KACC 22761]WPO77322.1 hypothetical protein SCB73_13715 [Flavobacterium sp. KACC 22761]